MLDDKVLYARLKEGCRRVADQLSWDRLTEQMEGYYAEVLAGANGVPLSPSRFTTSTRSIGFLRAPSGDSCVVSRPFADLIENLKPEYVWFSTSVAGRDACSVFWPGGEFVALALIAAACRSVLRWSVMAARRRRGQLASPLCGWDR